MPTNKNAMTRFMVIDKLLSNHHYPLTMDEITEKINEELAKFEIDPITRRCVEKDIQYLEYNSPWMVEIERKSISDVHPITGKNITKRCLSYKEHGYSIFKKQLSEDEKYLLSQVLGLLGQFDGLPEFDGLENLIKSLEIKQPNKIIQIEKNPLEDSTLLAQAYNAIVKQWTLDLHYHTFTESNKDKCIPFYPYFLKEYNQRWYLIGAAAKDLKILSFALDRIDAINPTPAIPFVAYKGNLSELYEDIIGVTYREDQPTIKVLFWLSDLSKDYVITKPLHESQRVLKNDKLYRTKYPMLTGGTFFEIEVQENYELIRELCSFGKELIVLSPVTLRNKILQRILDMEKEYRITNIE